MLHDTDIRTLNALIKVTIDSADGYRSAAEDAANSEFRKIFLTRANERDAVVAELQKHVRQHGGEPETGGSILASAHRFMMDIRDALTRSDDKAVIAEVERGEDHIKAEYERAMTNADLSADCRAIVSRVYESVRAGHEQMSNLKHGLSGEKASTAYQEI
jgi:uncharacterized protein (TIGR02284 family)